HILAGQGERVLFHIPNRERQSQGPDHLEVVVQGVLQTGVLIAPRPRLRNVIDEPAKPPSLIRAFIPRERRPLNQCARLARVYLAEMVEWWLPLPATARLLLLGEAAPHIAALEQVNHAREQRSELQRRAVSFLVGRLLCPDPHLAGVKRVLALRIDLC